MFAELNNQLPEFDFHLTDDLKLIFTKLNGISQSKPLKVRMLYLNKKGKYDPQYVVVAEDEDGHIYGVNLPSFITEEVDKIRRGKEYVDAINAGKCGIKCGPLIITSNGFETNRPVWVDLE